MNDRQHTLNNLVRRMRGETVTTCDQCGKSYVGADDTLFIRMHDAGIREDMEQAFCSWECAAHWFATRAGGVVIPDSDAMGESHEPR